MTTGYVNHPQDVIPYLMTSNSLLLITTRYALIDQKTMMKLLLLIGICISTVRCSYITFKPNQYDIQFNHTELQQKWALSSFAQIAENVIKLAQKDTPYDLLKDLIKIYVNRTTEPPSNIKQQVVDFELPYFIMAAFPLLLVLILPIFGILFCIKMCRQDEKNQMSELEVIQKKRVKRFFSASLVLTAATFILIAGIASYLASERLSSGAQLSKEMSSKSIDDLLMLTKGTASLLQIVLGDDFDTAIGKSAKSLNDLINSNHLSQHVINEIKEDVRLNIHHSVIRLWDLTAEAVLMVDPLIQSRNNIVLQSDRELEIIEKIQRDVITLHEQCEKSFSPMYCRSLSLLPTNGMAFSVNFSEEETFYSVCLPFFFIDFFVGQNFRHFRTNLSVLSDKVLSDKLVDFSDSEKKMQLFLLYDFNDTMTKTYESINNTGAIFFGDREKILEATKEMSTGLQEFKKTFLTKVNETSEKIVETLEPYRTKVTGWLKTDTTETTEMHFAFLPKLPCFLVFLLCVLLYGGVSAGQLGIAHVDLWEIDEFSPPMKLARLGKDLIISFIHTFFFICVFFLLLLAVLLFLGANMTHICDSLKDGSLIEKVIDDNKTWNGYPLGRMIHNDGRVPLKFSKVLSECSQGKSMWTVFKLEELMNTSGMTDIQSKYPHIQDVIEIGLINTTNFVPNFSINFTDHNLGIFEFNSSEIKLVNHTSAKNIKIIIDYLRKFYVETSYTHTDISELSYSVYVQVSILDTIIREEIKRSYKIYDHYEELLRQQMSLMSKQIVVVNQRRKYWKDYFENNFQDFLQQTLDFHLNGVMRELIQYGRYVQKELTSKIGKCKILAETYESIKTVFCFYATDSVNGLWLSFGTVIFSAVFFFPVYLELVAHYSIIALDFSSNDETLSSTCETNVKLNLRTAREVSNRDDTQWL